MSRDKVVTGTLFELVKNAYDADASECRVTMHSVEDSAAGRVVIEDDGSGMSLATITKVWLILGTDHRAAQRMQGHRSPKYGRLPLGEKGVGRLAVHKLGTKIELVTRVRGGEEVVVSVDWEKFDSNKPLAQIPVEIGTRPPEVFKGHNHGTRIEVRRLREIWTRGKVRDLHRALTSICSPFDKPEDFNAVLTLEPESEWLEKLLDVKKVLKDALFRASGHMAGNKLVYDYVFTPLAGMKDRIEGRSHRSVEVPLRQLAKPRGEVLDLSRFKIGKVNFDFYIFDREPLVLELCHTDKAGLKKFLDQNGGVRIYRDGVRVFDFGEPGNDWLDLGGRRVNIPTVRVSNNQMIGAISLDAAESTDLVEKTNREGFIENDAYEAFRTAVISAVAQVEAERLPDKDNLRKHYSRTSHRQPVTDELSDLRSAIDQKGLLPELGKHLDRIETQFHEVCERLLTAAGPGLTLTAVIHEVEKIIKELVEAVKQNADRQRIAALVSHLAEMVEGLAWMARKSGNSREQASTLIKQALFNTEFRFNAHGIKVVNGMERGCPDFKVKCVRRLIVSTLMNLFDNSIYWLDSRGSGDKQIYVGTTCDPDEKPTILVADNGPGFMDPPETLVQPFFSRKPDGMGLGLHIANEVAKLHNGRLLFPEQGDVKLPQQFMGAVVAIQFPKTA